jgi:hypothetical protein
MVGNSANIIEIKRQRINEIIAAKRVVYPLWTAAEEEVISQESDDDRIFDEVPLSIPNENNLQKFENELVVMPTAIFVYR